MEKEKQNRTKGIKELERFLKQKVSEKAKNKKAEKLSEEEMSSFFDQIVMPAYKTLEETMSQYNLGEIDIDRHVRVATFRISEPLSTFILKIDIDNGSRVVRVSGDLRYREQLRSKLLRVFNNNKKNIDFKEFESITSKRIISLFTEWYTQKDQNIGEAKEYREKKDN